jgi:hypothetical protein
MKKNFTKEYEKEQNAKGLYYVSDSFGWRDEDFYKQIEYDALGEKWKRLAKTYFKKDKREEYLKTLKDGPKKYFLEKFNYADPIPQEEEWKLASKYDNYEELERLPEIKDQYHYYGKDSNLIEDILIERLVIYKINKGFSDGEIHITDRRGADHTIFVKDKKIQWVKPHILGVISFEDSWAYHDLYRQYFPDMFVKAFDNDGNIYTYVLYNKEEAEELKKYEVQPENGGEGFREDGVKIEKYNSLLGKIKREKEYLATIKKSFTKANLKEKQNELKSQWQKIQVLLEKKEVLLKTLPNVEQHEFIKKYRGAVDIKYLAGKDCEETGYIPVRDAKQIPYVKKIFEKNHRDIPWKYSPEKNIKQSG